VHHVLTVFGYVDHHLERPQQEEIRKRGYHAYVDYRRGQADEGIGERVLRQGISMYELVVYILPEVDASDPWESSVLSLAIDVGNDLGVVVPQTVTAEDRGTVLRHYRAGETAYMAGCGPEA